ncbi:MAG: glycine cleavage system protein H, partial [Bacilli bacterium]
ITKEQEHYIVGITAYGFQEMGALTFVELPKIGLTFEVDDYLGAIESTKTVQELYAPLAGSVIDIQNELLDQLPHHPTGEDLELLRIASDDEETFMSYMTQEEYEQFVQ